LFDAIVPGTTAVSPDGDAIAVRNDEDQWIIVDPYGKFSDGIDDSTLNDWIVKYSPAAVRK